ncbi:hypothetical protein GCM10009798_34140 [Nocardioides panacihumi]|uniref:Leucine-binding protein domain-containing protein n=1 Tax=Nocardioides panacihumi TaxID=400774 RepID=A0ABN2RK60_9ACTN
MYRKKALSAVAAIGATALLTLTACGSSDDGSGTAGDAAGAGNSGGSASAKVLVVGDFTSTIPFTLPEIAPMVKGALKDLPDVKVETCDAKGTAPGFLACEQQAVVDKVAAVVLGFSGGGQDMSILTKAGIPAIGNGVANVKNSYPISESFSLYVALGAGLQQSGCSKLGIIYMDGSDALVDNIKNGFEGKGGKEVARAAVAANAADLSPAVAKVTEAGAECVAVSLPPAGGAQALTALRQSGKTVTVGGIAAVFSQQVLDALGPLADGLLVIDSKLSPADDAPGIQEAKATLQATDPKAPFTEQAVTAFVAAKIVHAALASATGDVDAKTFATALDGLRGVDMAGVIPAWSSEPLASKSFPQIFNHYGITYEIAGGKPVKKGDFYDTSDILIGK